MSRRRRRAARFGPEGSGHCIRRSPALATCAPARPGDQYPEDAALDAAGAADAGAADAGPAEAGVVEPPGALVAPPPPCVQPAMRAAANATVARVFQMFFMARNTITQAAAVLAMMVAWIPPTTTS